MTTKSLGILAGTAVAFGANSGLLAESVNADEVRAIVAEMMADSQARTLNLAGADAGHDGKFYMADGSGDFRLNVSGQIQFRYTANFSDDGGAVGDDFEGGFSTRRTKLKFHGNAFGDMFYNVTGAFDRDGGDFTLEDAYVGTNVDDNSKVRWGQFKLPFMREELVSSTRQLAADRSLVNETFNQGRSQGVEYSHNSDDFRFAVAFSDGFRSANTDWPAGPAGGIGGGGENDYAFTGRVEWKGAGEWGQFKDFSGAAGQDYGLLLGAAAHYQDHDMAGADVFLWTIDLSVEGDGWNVFAAVVGSHPDTNPATGGSTDDFGYVVQGGMFLPDSDWEIFARWDMVSPDSAYAADDDHSTLTFGVNNYIHGHAAKFTLDLQWHLDEANSITPGNSGIGYLGDDDEDEVAIRAQFQLLF